MLQKHKGRCAQEVEIYQKDHHEKINEKVAAEIAKVGSSSRSEHMEIRRRVAQSEYETESEVVKTAVREEYMRQKNAKEILKKSQDVDEHTPETYAK
jgi:hypothetical protein